MTDTSKPRSQRQQHSPKPPNIRTRLRAAQRFLSATFPDEVVELTVVKGGKRYRLTWH